MFIIYINDIENCTSANLNLFADDTTGQLSNDDLTILEQEANKEIDRLAYWFIDNQLTAHPGKTKFMIHQPYGKKVKINKKINEISLTMKGTKLEQCGETFKVQSIRFLGILIDSNLSWNLEIDKTASKVRSIIFLLTQVKSCTPPEVRSLLFKGLLMPHLEYGLTIYGNSLMWAWPREKRETTIRTRAGSQTE